MLSGKFILHFKKSRISINERKTTQTIVEKVGGKLIEKEEAEAVRDLNILIKEN